jgi:RimJ/RimL family protein N-acetyltransferase
VDSRLETPRLLLTPVAETDLAEVHALWVHPDVRRHLFDDTEISADEARALLDASRSRFDAGGPGLWLAREREGRSLAGFAGFLTGEDGRPSLVYGTHPTRWRQGYATEAARAVLTHARETLGLRELVADVDEPNAASVRVLEKLGLRRVRRAVVNERTLLYYALPTEGPP